MRAKGTLGSCSALDRSKTSCNGYRLFVVKPNKTCLLISKTRRKLRKDSDPMVCLWPGHTLPPRATPGTWPPHTPPCSPRQGMSATVTGPFIGQVWRIIKDNPCFRCLTDKVRYSLSISDVKEAPMNSRYLFLRPNDNNKDPCPHSISFLDLTSQNSDKTTAVSSASKEP